MLRQMPRNPPPPQTSILPQEMMIITRRHPVICQHLTRLHITTSYRPQNAPAQPT